MMIKPLLTLTAAWLFLVGGYAQNGKAGLEQRLTMITLGVKDLRVSERFYCESLGWKKVEPADENIVIIPMNGFVLALFDRRSLAKDAGVCHRGRGFRGFTISYNTGSEAEVDELFKQLIQKEIPVVKKPQRASWGGYSGYIRDPDGNLIEIAFNPFH